MEILNAPTQGDAFLYWNKIINEHQNTGERMPMFYHLLYYNFQSNKTEMYFTFIKNNLNVFMPYFKRLKKLYRKNTFYGIQINKEIIRLFIEEAENRTAYKGIRKQFQAKRNYLFQELLKIYDPQCRHCFTTENITIDHIKPLIKGGNNKLQNLQFLCQPCNSRKGVKCLVG